MDGNGAGESLPNLRSGLLLQSDLIHNLINGLITHLLNFLRSVQRSHRHPMQPAECIDKDLQHAMTSHGASLDVCPQAVFMQKTT